MCPDFVPIATRFCTVSYAIAVGWNGNPCLTVYKPSSSQDSLTTAVQQKEHTQTHDTTEFLNYTHLSGSPLAYATVNIREQYSHAMQLVALHSLQQLQSVIYSNQ